MFYNILCLRQMKLLFICTAVVKQRDDCGHVLKKVVSNKLYISYCFKFIRTFMFFIKWFLRKINSSRTPVCKKKRAIVIQTQLHINIIYRASKKLSLISFRLKTTRMNSIILRWIFPKLQLPRSTAPPVVKQIMSSTLCRGQKRAWMAGKPKTLLLLCTLLLVNISSSFIYSHR